MWHFLGIGAQKAGTTWLYRQLARHPEIAFPHGKEAHFWDQLQRRHGGAAAQSAAIRDYCDAFAVAGRRGGDITPAYAILPPDIIQQVHALAPALRLVFIMRNPLERAWSSALMALGRAEMTLDEASEQWFLDHFRSRGSLARGDYAACIRNWRAYYPAEQLLLLRFEQIGQAPQAVLQQCCAHLGVRAPDDAMLAHCRERAFEGPGHELPSRLRAELETIYRPRIEELQALLGEDFSEWR